MKITLLTVISGAILSLLPPGISGKLGEPRQAARKARVTPGMPVPFPVPKKCSNIIGNTIGAISTNSGSCNTRIVGGYEVTQPTKYPFFVSWDGQCGGSLIHQDIVLTAAHCFPIISNVVTVNAFELDNPTTVGAEVLDIETRVLHPDYDAITVENDFMLLKLSSPSSVDPIPINTDSSVPATGQNLTVIGLGATREYGCLVDRLREVTVPAVSDADCNVVYEGAIVEDVMLCAGGNERDACWGDSGGPIFTITDTLDFVDQVGVVSWGIGCGQPNVPGVYAETSGVKDWIRDQICALSSFRPDNCPAATPPPTPAPPGPDEARVDITVVTDTYPFESYWQILDNRAKIVELTEPGEYSLPNYSYETSVNLKKGEQYIFEMHDTYGDGLYYGGFYEVKTGSVVLASGSEFGFVESTPFVMPGAQQTAPPTTAGDIRVVVNVKTDRYPFETSWTVFDEAGSVVERAAQGTYTLTNQFYTTEIYLAEKEYSFKIEDGGGDGLCCDYGEGYYNIRTAGGTIGGVVLAQGAEFEYSETAFFTVTS